LLADEQLNEKARDWFNNDAGSGKQLGENLMYAMGSEGI